MAKSVTVIGAGIVGVCCALYLQREGFRVQLVEKGEPGRKASFGNSGSFGTASCVPFAMPGVLKKVPKMLFDSTSPLKLRWSHVPSALPWFLRFIASARPSRVEEIAAARNSLLVHTHAGYAPLIEGADAKQWVKDDGLMMLFESEETFQNAAYALDLRRRHGVHMDILDGNEARQMEPALSQKIIKAVSLPDVNRTIDPWRLCDSLAQDFVRRGGEIINAEVRGFEIGGEGPTKIVTDRGPMDVETVVLAAGVWSRPLARQLGTSVPLEAERGYHVMFAGQDFGLRRALVSADRNVSLAHMHEGIRATGVAEFAAPDAPADMRIADMIAGHAKQLVPGLKGEPASKWMGPRPSHPDSKPVIGRSPRHKNVFFAFGHDHLGLTMAGITGKLIAELATGKPTTVDLAPFRPDRSDMLLAAAYKWDFGLVLSYTHLWAKGLGVTLAYSVGTVVGGMIIGVICGLLLLVRSRWVTLPVHYYVEIFRCTPLLVQIVWFYYALPIVLQVELPDWFAAGLGLTLYMGAFATEIFRGGIISIDKGQWQASRALGMTGGELMRHIILPQATKRMIPPFVNQSIIQLKNTSLLYVVAIPDLMYTGSIIVSDTFRPLEVYTSVAIAYFVILYPLTLWAARLEARVDQ